MKPADVSRHYDRLDVWYRSLWGDHLHHGLWNRETASREEAALNLLRSVASAMRLERGMKVCDVGCGYGGPARWLTAETGAVVTGVTNSRKQFNSLGAATGPVTPVLADWIENGLPAESFDRVLSLESISHFPNPAAALQEMWRVLKPGGRMVIATWTEQGDLPDWVKWLWLAPIRKAGVMPGLSTGGALRRALPENAQSGASVQHLGDRVGKTWSSGMTAALWQLISDRGLRRDALRHPIQTLRLAVSSLLIWLGYRFDILDYLILTVEKPADGNAVTSSLRERG